MTFRDVVIKNLKYNASKYIAYFLSGVFIIIVLFMHSTVVYNPEIIRQLEGTTLYSLMKGSFCVLTIFSFFFIGFINSSFMRERNKEFGMFLTLGMTKKYICKIIIIESSIIVLVSMIFGIIFGMIFSRLFFMIVIKIIGLNIEYSVSSICLFLSLSIFLGIFIVICVKALLYTNKLEISQLLKENKKSEKMGANKPLYAFICIYRTHYNYYFLCINVFNYNKNYF
ncbi:FtsX-like permease family protein [Clostridium lundense]|uniref:FtsX-like permease family protein n=1 Tax=Clostridium lundense TaxID=319475 RepID=UPI00048A0240|nr:FtsX-like permease family protein [Clostridium lundense]